MENTINTLEEKLFKLRHLLLNGPWDNYECGYIAAIILLVEKHNLDNSKSFVEYEDINSLVKALNNSSEEYAKLCSKILQTSEPIPLEDKILIDNIRQFIKSLDPIDFQKDFNDIFEYLLDSAILKNSRMSSVIAIPEELAQLTSYFCPQKQGVNIYNPFVTIDGFVKELPMNSNYTGQVMQHHCYFINQLRALVLGLNNAHYSFSSCFDNWIPDSTKQNFDFIIGCPPFRMKVSSKDQGDTKSITSDAFILNKCSEAVKASGKAVCIIPAGLLTSSIKYEKQLRKQIVSADLLETVIILPGNIFTNTGITTAIMVLNHNKDHKGMVRFVDASNDFVKESLRLNKLNLNSIINSIKSDNKESKLISIEGIAHNDYDLTPARYLLEEIKPEYGEKVFALGNVLKEIKGESTKFDAQLGEKVILIKIKNLSDDKLKKFSSFEDIEVNNIKPGTPIQIISGSCLLIARGGGKLKQTYFNYKDKPIAIANRNISAYKVNTELIDKKYLLFELDADHVKDQVQAYYSSRTIMTALTAKDLLNIKIRVLSLIDQQRAKASETQETYAYKMVAEASASYDIIGKIEQESYEGFALLKHSLKRPIANMSSNIDNIEHLLKSLGVMTEYISKKHNRTLEDAINGLKNDLMFLDETLNKNDKGLDLKNYPLETMNFKKFINSYFRSIKYSDNSFEVYLDVDDSVNNQLLINGNKELLKIIFDNIVENAETHAFVNKNRTDYELVFKISQNTTSLSIDIADNGKGFPLNFDKTKFIRKNSSAGKTAGSGLGGYEINRSIEYLGGTFELTLDDKQYPTIYNIDIPISIE